MNKYPKPQPKRVRPNPRIIDSFDAIITGKCNHEWSGVVWIWSHSRIDVCPNHCTKCDGKGGKWASYREGTNLMFKGIEFIKCESYRDDLYEIVDEVRGILEVRVAAHSRAIAAVIKAYKHDNLNANLARYFLWRNRRGGLTSIKRVIIEDNRWMGVWYGEDNSFNSQCVFNKAEKFVFVNGGKT